MNRPRNLPTGGRPLAIPANALISRSTETDPAGEIEITLRRHAWEARLRYARAEGILIGLDGARWHVGAISVRRRAAVMVRLLPAGGGAA